MDKSCVFCKIVAGEMSAEIIYKDSEIAIFKTIKPSAPIHLLIIPREHVEDLSLLEDRILIKIKNRAMEIVDSEKLDVKGYRIVTNGGAAKAVSHLHFHLLGEVAVQRKV